MIGFPYLETKYLILMYFGIIQNPYQILSPSRPFNTSFELCILVPAKLCDIPVTCTCTCTCTCRCWVCCVALPCLFVCFFLPSFSSLIKTCAYMYVPSHLSLKQVHIHVSSMETRVSYTLLKTSGCDGVTCTRVFATALAVNIAKTAFPYITVHVHAHVHVHV